MWRPYDEGWPGRRIGLRGDTTRAPTQGPRPKGGRHDAALSFPFGIGTKATNRHHLFECAFYLISRPRFLHFTLNHYNLTDPSQQSLLDISIQELTGNWDTYAPGDAPTQRLGAALYATRDIEGFLAISAKMPPNKTLIVFPQKLRKGSELVFQDIITGGIHRIAPC